MGLTVYPSDKIQGPQVMFEVARPERTLRETLEGFKTSYTFRVEKTQISSSKYACGESEAKD